MSAKYKNLVVIHLESLSEHLWPIYSNDMPFISSMRQRSIDFLNCFSTATSTEMSKVGLFMEDTGLGNDMEYFSRDNLSLKGCVSVFSILREKKFKSLGIAFSEDKEKIWPVWKETFDDFIPDMNNEKELFSKLDLFFQEKNKPFAFYFHDLYSHIEGGRDIKIKCSTFYERQAIGYRHVDDLIKKIYNKLESAKCLDETLWLFWGDHGDDYWTHSYHPTLVHGFVPHSTMIHVPLFFFAETGLAPKKIKEINSTSEVAETLLKQLDCYKKVFCPQNVIKDTKIGKIIFSQNLFTNQYEPPLLNKGYAAVSNNYILLVTRAGLEMYDWKSDPCNQHNLLMYLNLKDEKLHVVKESAQKSLTRYMFNESILERLNLEFFELRKELINYITKKENDLRLQGKLENPLSKRYFTYFNKEKSHPSYLLLKYPNIGKLYFHIINFFYRQRARGIKIIFNRFLRRFKK